MALGSKTTQNFVPIKEVRGGIIILKDGGMRTILMASSTNLALKSEEEQKAIISQFQAFLNSLDFSTQIVIQSKKLDIKPYLILLENRMKEQEEPLLKIQTREYIEFIRSFTEEVNIMTKNFYVVVPYTLAPFNKGGGLREKFLGSSQKNNLGEKISSFEESRSQLEQRMEVIQQGLSRVGIQTIRLGAEEVVELFYKIFNPGDTTQSIKIE